MMFDFRGEGGGSKMIQKNQTLEGENRTLGEEGVNNDQKKSDIIYGRSLFSNNFVALRMYKFCKVFYGNIMLHCLTMAEVSKKYNNNVFL